MVVGGQPQNNSAAAYHHQLPPQLTLPPPLPPTVVTSQQQQPLSSSSSALQSTPLPPVVPQHHHHNNPYQHQHHQAPPPLLSSADETWRAAIDRQIEQKFNSYTSSKKQHPQQQQQQHELLPPILQPQQGAGLPPAPSPAQADKRTLEILKQNIEARDQSSRPQIAEAPSTPAMVFSTPIRKEPSTTPLKKTDYYMAERTGATPFPKKIDFYMDRAYCNAPRIRTKAERKQVSAEGSSSGMRMSSPMAAATAISPHPFLPSNNSTPQIKQEEQTPPLTQTEPVMDIKPDIKREPLPVKDPELCLLNKDVEKDDDEEFWMNTCNSFVVQLAETQEKKVKTTVKRKSPKEQIPQPPKRKYTKRIKIEPVSEIEQHKKLPDIGALKPAEETNSEKSLLDEKVVCEDKTIKEEPLDMDKENKAKLVDKEKSVDNIKENEESAKVKPKRKRLLKPLLITKVKKPKKEDKKELKTKEKKEAKKEVKKEMKKGEKKETMKVEKKEMLKKELLLQKLEKKELAAAAKEEKKGLKKEEKRDLKKDIPDNNNKKDHNNKKEGKKAEVARKKVAAEKENATKINENTTRRTAAEATGKLNPRQSLRRKNSLKDYTFAFDELLDDAFAHFEAVKTPVKKRPRKCASPSPSPPSLAVAVTQATTVVKKSKDNETIRMRLRSRNRPLLTKQEPQQIAKKKANVKNNIPKRRRKKSLGEQSATTTSTTDDWKDELYKFKRSLRLPSKLISVVSPPSAGAVAPDQVSLTSIMNIPQHKPVKDTKLAKSVSQSQVAVTGAAGKNCKAKRLGHLQLFGRRDVFKGRRLLKREKIVSAEKLMQRNRRKKRQQEEDDDKKEVVPEEDNDAGCSSGKKPPKRVVFKRKKFMRKKFRSGFDYIKKKKKKEPAVEKKPPAPAAAAAAAAAAVPVPVAGAADADANTNAVIATTVSSVPPQKSSPRYVSEIQAEIRGWIINKGHGETVLHRASRLGVKDVVGFCIEKLGFAVSVGDNAGYTPLHEACAQGHYEIAKLLLQLGANVSASAQGGIRPLHEAIESGNVHLVRLLLGYGADPHLGTYAGQSPLSLVSDRQTRMLLEHHVNDVQGLGSASAWNFDHTILNREHKDVDQLLWCSPPSPSSPVADDDLSFEFEFADHLLPDVYKMPVNKGDATVVKGDTDADALLDDWVLFTDVSEALSVQTADALSKLLDDEHAVTSVPVDLFNELVMPRKILGRQPFVAKPIAANKPSEQTPKNTVTDSAASVTADKASSTTTGERILLVRYNNKLKELLGVATYTVS